jgi:hypothetical protein
MSSVYSKISLIPTNMNYFEASVALAETNS